MTTASSKAEEEGFYTLPKTAMNGAWTVKSAKVYTEFFTSRKKFRSEKPPEGLYGIRTFLRWNFFGSLRYKCATKQTFTLKNGSNRITLKKDDLLSVYIASENGPFYVLPAIEKNSPELYYSDHSFPFWNGLIWRLFFNCRVDFIFASFIHIIVFFFFQQEDKFVWFRIKFIKSLDGEKMVYVTVARKVFDRVEDQIFYWSEGSECPKREKALYFLRDYFGSWPNILYPVELDLMLYNAKTDALLYV